MSEMNWAERMVAIQQQADSSSEVRARLEAVEVQANDTDATVTTVVDVLADALGVTL